MKTGESEFAGNPRINLDSFEVQADVVRHDLHPGTLRGPQFTAIIGINVISRAKGFSVHTLYEEEDHATVPAPDHILKLHQVFETTRGHRVGKARHAVFNKGTILDFDEAAFAPRALQDYIQSRVGTTFDLALQCGVSGQWLQLAVDNGLRYQIVWNRSIYPDQRSGHVYHFPCVPQSSLLIVTTGEVNRPAGLAACFHASRIRAVSRYDVSVTELDVGHKPLIPLQKGAGDQLGPSEALWASSRR